MVNGARFQIMGCFLRMMIAWHHLHLTAQGNHIHNIIQRIHGQRAVQNQLTAQRALLVYFLWAEAKILMLGAFRGEIMEDQFHYGSLFLFCFGNMSLFWRLRAENASLRDSLRGIRHLCQSANRLRLTIARVFIHKTISFYNNWTWLWFRCLKWHNNPWKAASAFF